MSAVSEEDVLAILVLYEAQPVTTNVDSAEQFMERVAWNHAVRPPPEAPLSPVAIIAAERLRDAGSVEAAIADSERRYEAERCEREVLDAVEEWDGSISSIQAAVNLRRANAKLRRARMVLAHAR